MWEVVFYRAPNGTYPVADVLVHGFAKKSQKLPAKELQTAASRMKDYLRRKDDNK